LYPAYRGVLKALQLIPQHFLVKCDTLYETNKFYRCESITPWTSVLILISHDILFGHATWFSAYGLFFCLIFLKLILGHGTAWVCRM